MKFPESSLAIINSNTELGTALNVRRPQFIEERRLALQAYIKDLLRMDMIRNSRAFRCFLDIDRHLRVKSSSGYQAVFSNPGSAREIHTQYS